jgi:membrane protein
MASERPALDRLKDLLGRLQQSFPAQVASRFSDTYILSISASISFYTLLSLAPLVLLLLWGTTFLLPAAKDEFFRQIETLAGPEAKNTAQLIVENASATPDTGSVAALLGGLVLLFGASIVFAQLQQALNRIFRAENQGLGGVLGFLRKRLIGMGVVFGLGFLIVVSMIAHALLQLVIDQLPGGMGVYSVLIAFVLYGLVFGVVYHVLPDRPAGWKLSMLGGFITAALFLVGRWAIGLYLGHAALGSAYGPAGGLVVLLVWIYYSAIVFFTGGLLTAMFDERRKEGRAAQPW